MTREIKMLDFVRVHGIKGIKVVLNIKDDNATVIGIDLSEDEDTIICKSSIHKISELKFIDESMVNIIGILWDIRDELVKGSFERMVYDNEKV